MWTAAGARARPVLGREDDRELPHVRHARRRQRGLRGGFVPRCARARRAASSSRRSSSRVAARSPRRAARRVLALARDLAADPADRRALDHRQPWRARDALARRPRDGPDLARPGGDHPPRLQGLEPQRAREPRLAAQLGGFHNVLALSGDYPVMGHRGLAAPVFDIDSVGLLSLFARDERGPYGRAQAGARGSADGLLPRLRRHEPQAARARGDAAVLQAPQEGAGGRALRHQPDRLEHAQGRRAPALDPPRRPRARTRSRTSISSPARRRAPSTAG